MNYCRDHSNEYYLELIHQKKRKPCTCGRNKGYRVRTAYVCACGNKYYPLAGTIFQKSRTPLKVWFYVIELFTKAKSGLSAMFISRVTGVTYKCAWRMLHKIRELMGDDGVKFEGAVEADETFFKAKPYRNSRIPKGRKAFFNAPIVFGVVERSSGRAKVKVIPDVKTSTIFVALRDRVELGSTVHTDGSWGYRLAKVHYNHVSRIHWADYKKGENGFIPQAGDSTQQIENFWSQLKRGVYGVYRAVKRLQAYANEFAFRYSYRGEDVFEALVARI